MEAIKTPWSSIGYLTYKRTYSRRLNPADQNSKTEEWEDTVDRVIEGAEKQLKCNFSEDEQTRLKRYMLELKGTVAGRFLWQLGTSTVDMLGLLSLQNCAACVVDHPVQPFTWAMDALMLGCGVGYNIQREYVYKLPPVREDYVAPIRQDDASADFIVADTRQGWVKLLEYTLRGAFYESDKRAMTYSTILVRGKGTPIKGFGGTASGPEDLAEGIQNIGKVLEARAGKQLRPIDCLDIMNIIGSIVVAGNVRRSAQIAIGDCDDLQFLKAKNWSEGNIPNWRAFSNNTVVCNDINNLPEEFWKTYEGGSEPYGLINLKLARSCGRIGDTQYKDKLVIAFNPCSEQSLNNYETCCLAEVFLPNISSYEEFIDVIKLLYRVNKHSLSLPCHQKKTETVVNNNMRMGIGVTGILQASQEQLNYLPKAYEELRQYDVEYSKLHGFPISIKLTTCKPSGTLSLLPGVLPGIHPGFARHMIRRIRMDSNHPLVNVCRLNGYKVEYQRRYDRTEDYNTVVVEFPFSYPEGAILAKDLSYKEQLDYVRFIQKAWSDNGVSCTVYYKKEELEDIKAYLKKHWNKEMKTVSFLLHNEHGFDQPPFEEITKEEYDKLVSNTKLITSCDTELMFDGSDCESGVCPVR